ncbi:MAG TPA: DHA2 family efflux MFS transporter permease subunit [Solirubrobacteraceae bacterium]|jgi:EmrB/QacA subfamily drug resistance transporter|nr:DHA2 family efflux MFS transporter permease subunit [Solirubrobacteraceae bacterium]
MSGSSENSRRSRNNWTLGIVSTALFMVVLDNLVVSIALPSIHRDLGASIQSLEWTVNAYVLSYAVLLLTGAALGDRFGRRRMFLAGLSLFTAASASAALAPTTDLLVAARAVQGAGAALVTPLTLTLLAEAFPAERRGLALGIWSGISGAAVALGPLLGGAVVQGISWHWIFWINVPIGLILVPLAALRLRESHGPYGSLDLPGLALASTGAFGLVFGLVRAQSLGWTSTRVLTSIVAGVTLVGLFVAWERRAPEPMLPMSFFSQRAFAVTNFASLTMYFGMFGSIFFLSQFMQDVLHNSPLQAGLKILVWTGATMITAPLAGIYSQRVGSRPLMFAGLTLQAGALAWLAGIISTSIPYSAMIVPFVMAGAGMALVFAPSANAVLSAVLPAQAGQASGATNAIRETGGVLGVAVLASVFTHAGGYGSPQAFVNGVVPALWVAVGMLTAGAVAVLALPSQTRPAEQSGAVVPAADATPKRVPAGTVALGGAPDLAPTRVPAGVAGETA